MTSTDTRSQSNKDPFKHFEVRESRKALNRNESIYLWDVIEQEPLITYVQPTNLQNCVMLSWQHGLKSFSSTLIYMYIYMTWMSVNLHKDISL